MADLRERLMDAIGVLDTDPALAVFADWLREHTADDAWIRSAYYQLDSNGQRLPIVAGVLELLAAEATQDSGRTEP